MPTHKSVKHGFVLDSLAGWIVETEELDLTEQGASDGVEKQLRILNLHPSMSPEDFEEKYEEVMVMKQVLTTGKTLEEFTKSIREEMDKTNVQLRMMGIDPSQLSDDITISDTTMDGVPAKAAILPLFMPIPTPDGYIVVLKRPTFQRWCMVDPKTAFVLTYLAVDKVFIERIGEIKKCFDSFHWLKKDDAPPPSFPELKQAPTPSPKDAEEDDLLRLLQERGSTRTERKKKTSVQSDTPIALIVSEESDDEEDISSSSASSSSSSVPAPRLDAAQQLVSDVFDSVLNKKPAPAPVKETKAPSESGASSPSTPIHALPVSYRFEETHSGRESQILLNVPLTSDVTKRDIKVNLSSKTISVNFHGSPVIEGTLFAEIDTTEDCLWYIEGSTLTIPLNKKYPTEQWDVVIAGTRVDGDRTTIDACSLTYLGRNYADKGDIALSFKLFQEAADKNYLEAQLFVADVLSGGTSFRCRPFASIEKNEALGLKYWRMAAGKPHNSPEAMYRLGRAAFYGVKDSPPVTGQRQSAKEALNWFEEAAKFEHTMSLYFAGLLKYNGGIPPCIMEEGSLRKVPFAEEGEHLIVNADKRKGIAQLRRAASLLTLDANITLGYLYLSGSLPGVPTVGPAASLSISKAKEFFEKAKAIDAAKTWDGPPKEYFDALEEEERKTIAARAPPPQPQPKVEVAAPVAAASQNVGNVLWDNGVYLSVGAVVAAFGYHYYRKLVQ